MGHLHIGLAEFLVFALYYIVLKAFIHVANVETRRNGMHVPAAVTGLLA
jgi:hypothetical protein